MLALFVMEVGLEGIPTYAGGLGTLMGDVIHTFADLNIPITCVTLLYKKGYVRQRINQMGEQVDLFEEWDYKRELERLDVNVEVELFGRKQRIAVWQKLIRDHKDVKIFFLDADVEGNDPEVRKASERLYTEDLRIRLIQEAVLGIGGYRLLEKLGIDVSLYHINESHSALLLLELLNRLRDKEEVRKRVIFSTHTALPVGHDRFPLDLVKACLTEYKDLERHAEKGTFDLTHLAVHYASLINAVSLKHKFMTERFFLSRKVDYITNGVYHKRWVCEEMAKLFDTYLPGWDKNPYLLISVYNIPSDLLLEAHRRAKERLINFVNKRYNANFSYEAFTLCVARRMTAYKRVNLLFKDTDKLIRIAQSRGLFQVIFAGKAHPADNVGKEMIRDIHSKMRYIRSKTEDLRVAFIEDYDIETVKLLVAGCDVWLNNPKRPYEACGTSGMKAGMNGVLNFSVWDGWWLEGGIEGVNGWGIGPKPHWTDLSESNDDEDLQDIYGKLSYLILPLYYKNKDEWVRMMKASIATIGSYFNTYRMVSDYISKVYTKGLRW